MSPRILVERDLVFWFHSHDALHEERASVHVGKGSQDDVNDAKIWLEPGIGVARRGRTLREHELSRALQIIQQHQAHLREQWHEYRGRAR
jgi:hypothetical protein